MSTSAVICMALALYHEGRGEDWVGQIAIGQVAMNRVYDKRWPDDVCSVLKQGPLKHGSKKRCQFSFYCDGRSERVDDVAAWEKALFFADRIVKEKISIPSLARATCYHSVLQDRKIQPYWTKKSVFINQIGNHRFYAC